MTSEVIDVSYVVVSWNAKKLLQRCLASLNTAQHSLRYEVIVIENASSDGSREMVRTMFPEVRLVSNKINSGFSKASNQGIELARGNYICLVNSDVEVFADTIRLLHEFMETHPDVGLLGPKVLNPDRSLQTSCRTFPTLLNAFFRAFALDTSFPRSRLLGDHFMTHWDYESIREVDILSGCFWMTRRRALNEVGLLDTRFFIYGEDMDFCRRFHHKGWKVMFLPEAEIIHYGHGSSNNAPARFWVEMQKANLQYWQKHHSRLGVVVYYWCLLLQHGVRTVGLVPRLAFAIGSRTSVKIKLAMNWDGLRWLLKPSTIAAVLHGSL